MTNDNDLIPRGDALECFMGLDRIGDIKDEIAALPAAPMGAWKDIADYDEDRDQLVQVLCRVLPDIAGDFPRSSDFPISSGDHAVGDLFVSIGFCNDDGHWAVAGWDMTQDCFTDASLYEVLAWQPLAPAALTAQPARTPAEAQFADWFRLNYPGPDTIIHNPDWHAPRIFRAAITPQPAPTLGDALELPEIKALVDALSTIVCQVDDCGEFTEKAHADAKTALAKLKGDAE